MEKKKRKRKKRVRKRRAAGRKARIRHLRPLKIALGALGVLIAFSAILLGAVQMVRAFGKKSLLEGAQASGPDLTAIGEMEPEEEGAGWQEGWVKYGKDIYAYNQDIMTFLIMGIDKNTKAQAVEEGTNGGQADALFLAVMDPHKKTIKIVGINRNAMADIDIYDENGAYVTTAKAQIAVQHGFGDGMEKSCAYQKKAVENLFYGLPIHGYAAVNMSAIATINDAVGGVEVEVLEDLTGKDKTLVKGERVRLLGESAFWYVKYRDTYVFASADMRLARQKQYLNAFIGEAKKAAKKDITVVLDLYKAIEPMMVTDITLDEAAYLAPVLLDYEFNKDSFYLMEGETVKGEKFEEFYVDEEALYEMILEIFYEKVERQV